MNNLNKRLQIADILSYSVILIPIWWILGVKFFIFQLIAFYIITKVFSNECFNDKDLKTLTIGIGIYIISTLIALTQNPLGSEGLDLLSPIYLLSYWIMGVFIIVGINCMKINSKQFLKLIKAFLVIGVACIILLIVGAIMWSNNQTIFNSNAILYNILPDGLKIKFFEQLTRIQYVWVDWINGVSAFRFNAFYIYPTACAIGTLVVIVYSLLYFSIGKPLNIVKSNEIFNKAISVLYIVLLVIAMCLARSRMVFMASILGAFIIIFIYLTNKNNWKKILCISLTIVLVGIVLILSLNLIEKILMMRAGSNSERFKVYQATLETFSQHPIFGVGVRFFTEESYIPIGSHSTYLGVLMRSGIVGFTGIMIFLVSVCRRVIKNKSLITNKNMKNIWIATSYLFIAMSIWMITDDIDWPTIVALYYFINIGLIFKFKDLPFNIKEN